MKAGRPSRTAEHVALFRAIESARPADERLFCDPLAARFLGPRLRLVATASRLPFLGRAVPSVIDRRWPGPRPSVVIRTRMIDDAASDALARGVEQLVILGAGYDSRAYRLPGADGAEVFEVDHPATQAVKRRAIEAAYGRIPAHVRFVAIDFDRDPLAETLRNAGLREDATGFFIWEGVLSYLEMPAIEATLRWIAGAAAAGSRLVFTYVDRAALDAADPAAGLPWIRAVERAGEPFRTGLVPAEVPDLLERCGLRLLSDDSTAAAHERYGARGLSREPIPDLYRVALAESV